MQELAVVEFENYGVSLPEALDRIDLPAKLAEEEKIVIKPNLTDSVPPPATTDLALIEVLCEYCLEHAAAEEVIVAEGSGTGDTFDVFEKLGYRRLAERSAVRLVDLDREKVVWKEEPKARVHRKFPLPAVLTSGFLISAPVLKVHPSTRVTLCLKNMIGIAPQEYFGGSFNKSKMHKRLDEGIVDLNLHCRPDLSVLDATIGQKGSHLRGTPCDPPKNRLICGYDPVEVDREGCKLLDIDPDQVEHIVLAGKLL